jgi:FAD/FMN-containing dehydrogenase
MFEERFQGRFVERETADHAEYEAARTGALFNGRHPSRYPVAILEAANEADVASGVLLAKERGWKVATRSGGHAWAGWSVRDDALMIDLAAMRELTVDVDNMTATATPALRGGQDLAPFLASHDLIFPGGHCSTVGLGGYLLQGGQGWNSRQWGWGCENVLGVDLVTADGDFVHADAENNSDLYWAARGAGPAFFGVVTRLHLRVHRMPSAFTHTTYAFPIECFDELISWAHDVLPTLDTRVEPVIVGTRIPPPDIDVDLGGGPLLIMHTTGMFDTPDEARRLMAPLETCPVLGRALLRVFAEPASFDDEYTIMDAQNPRGMRYSADCTWTDATGGDLLPALGNIYRSLPTPESFVIWYGWAPSRPLQDMAFSMEGNVYIAAYTIWQDEADDAAMQEWVTSRFRELEPLSKGSYLGDADLTRRSSKFMADANFAKLQRLRDIYDRDRRFFDFYARPGVVVNEFESR